MVQTHLSVIHFRIIFRQLFCRPSQGINQTYVTGKVDFKWCVCRPIAHGQDVDSQIDLACKGLMLHMLQTDKIKYMITKL